MIRCAIYTRKSTEDGLEQDFNSLHAQREACEAFIRSQQGEGWRAIGKEFDDGGYSGAMLDRPALARLLEAVRRREVDTIVVYKVDRLTRSLADFAKIVELLDAHGVSFVSVTQQFNTTTSMGRLTLNVLLSFAQFEREVTAERIRDKIAASKKKGLWMGGPPPLGYEARDRTLVIIEPEAEQVRTLFRLYLELGTVRRLKEEADRRGIVTKRRRRKDGGVLGGNPFSRGNFYQLLANPLYVGRIPHKGQIYPGQHQPIVDDATWEAVQRQLASRARDRRSARNVQAPALLRELAYDETGDRLSSSHACRRGRRYRYYISRRLMHEAHKHRDGWRIPAKELEAVVIGQLAGLMKDRSGLLDITDPSACRPQRLVDIYARADGIAEELLGKNVVRQREIIEAAVHRIDVSPSSVSVSIRRSALMQLLDLPGQPHDSGDMIRREAAIRLQRRGVEMKLVVAGSGAAARPRDEALCQLIARARGWFAELASGSATSVREIATRDGVHETEVSRMLPLAFLAPDIVEAILEARHPVDLTVEKLKRLSRVPANWADQRRLLGFAP